MGADVHLPQSGARGLERLPFLKYNVLKQENRLKLWIFIAKNTDYEKKPEVKVVENSISYKKLRGRTCLSPLRMELGDSKDCRV